MINYGYKLDNIWLRIYKSYVLFKIDVFISIMNWVIWFFVSIDYIYV